MGEQSHIPHLLLVGARPEVVGKLLGLPLALTVAQQAGGSAKIDPSLPLRVVDCDLVDSDSLYAAVSGVHAARRIDAVLGLTEVALLSASQVGEALSTRVNPSSCVELTLNKAAMRQRLAERGLDRTKYRICRSLEEVGQFASELSPDGLILKPVDGNGGTGVSLVRDAADLATAWDWAAAAADGGSVLAEQFLTGREISVESVSVAGEHLVLALTAKLTTGAPHFVEIGHDIPAMLSAEEQSVVTATVLQALDAVGHTWGPCHTEIMLSGGQPSVVEINTRMGGDRIWELVELAVGVSLAGASAMALGHGQLPVVPQAPRRAASIRFLRAEPGHVVSVTGVEQALATPDVVRIGDLRRPGEDIHRLTDYRDRAGYVIAAGGDAERAQRAADRAACLIRIETDSEGYVSRSGAPTVLRTAPR